MIVALLFSVYALAADESSLLIKSAKFCFLKPLVQSPSQWIGSACKSGALFSVSRDRDSIQVIVDNAKHMPRAFLFTKSLSGMHTGGKIILNSADFIATCGQPLVLEIAHGSVAQLQLSSGDGVAVNASSLDLKSAAKTMAGDMKNLLLQQISNEPQAYANNNIKACYSGLQTTLKNFQLDDVLSAGEKKGLDSAIYPTKGVSPSNGTTDR